MEGMSRGQMQDLLMQFAAEDTDYRSKLIENPRYVVENQFGYEIPEGVEVKAVIETADTAYIVVPHVAGEGELDDADLEKVAGGMGDKKANCNVGGTGVMNTQNIFNF